MYLGPSPLPAAAAYLKDALLRTFGAGAPVANEVDWSNKAAVVQWIREQRKGAHASWSLQDRLPFASLPPAILVDLDVGLAVADVEPAALAKLSPVLLENLEVARRALAADRTSHRLFAPALLRQLSQPARAAALFAEPVSELERALEVVRTRPLALGELSLAMRNNPDVVATAAAGDPAALAYASKNLWIDPHFMAANLPSSPEAASRVLGKLVRVHGDEGAAVMLSNHHVATLVSLRSNVIALPLKTREVIDRALATTMQRRHPLAPPRRPSPFSES
jgi:hypothetical protein